MGKGVPFRSYRERERESKRKSKVKCTLVQALRFCTVCTTHRGSRGMALVFLDHDTRRG